MGLLADTIWFILYKWGHPEATWPQNCLISSYIWDCQNNTVQLQQNKCELVYTANNSYKIKGFKPTNII